MDSNKFTCFPEFIPSVFSPVYYSFPELLRLPSGPKLLDEFYKENWSRKSFSSSYAVRPHTADLIEPVMNFLKFTKSFTLSQPPNFTAATFQRKFHEKISTMANGELLVHYHEGHGAFNGNIILGCERGPDGQLVCVNLHDMLQHVNPTSTVVIFLVCRLPNIPRVYPSRKTI
jgi:hypothetical protein